MFIYDGFVNNLNYLIINNFKFFIFFIHCIFFIKNSQELFWLLEEDRFQEQDHIKCYKYK